MHMWVCCSTFSLRAISLLVCWHFCTFYAQYSLFVEWGEEGEQSEPHLVPEVLSVLVPLCYGGVFQHPAANLTNNHLPLSPSPSPPIIFGQKLHSIDGRDCSQKRLGFIALVFFSLQFYCYRIWLLLRLTPSNPNTIILLLIIICEMEQTVPFPFPFPIRQTHSFSSTIFRKLFNS